MKKFLKTAGLSAVFSVAAALTSQAAVTVAAYQYADIELDGYIGASATYDKTSSGRGLADKGRNYTLGDSEVSNIDATKFGVKVANKQSGVSAYVSALWVPDSHGDNNEAGILDAYLEWSKTTNAGTFTITGGKFLSYFGYESFYIPKMDQISYGLVTGIPGYHTGIKLDYSKDVFSTGVAVLDSLYSGDGFQQGDGKIGGVGVEVFAQYVFNDKFTLFGGLGYDGGNRDGLFGEGILPTKSDFVFDVWGKFAVNDKLTLSAELTYTDREAKKQLWWNIDNHQRAFSWLVFAKYDFIKGKIVSKKEGEPDTYYSKLSLVARVSGLHADDGWTQFNGSQNGNGFKSTTQYKFTLAPSYAFNEHFLIRTEFSWTHGDKGSFETYRAQDNYFFGAQAVFQF